MSNVKQNINAWREKQLRNEARIERELKEEAALKKAAATKEEELLPVEGDVLPPIGTQVQIHLASLDKWVTHTVVGYYVWNSLINNPVLHRVFVRVRHPDGNLNARMLCDVRWKP